MQDHRQADTFQTAADSTISMASTPVILTTGTIECGIYFALLLFLSVSFYRTKKYEGYLDLHENDNLVSKPEELDDSLHSAHLFQSKVRVYDKAYNIDTFYLVISCL